MEQSIQTMVDRILHAVILNKVLAPTES